MNRSSCKRPNKEISLDALVVSIVLCGVISRGFTKSISSRSRRYTRNTRRGLPQIAQIYADLLFEMANTMLLGINMVAGIQHAQYQAGVGAKTVCNAF